jgi:RNA polymerase sigma-70 factor (ECF subfamily)
MSSAHDTPASLLERLRQPDAAAWSRFVRLYTPLLYAWACRLRLQPADAADLLQEVFTLLVKELPQFHYQTNGSFRGWLRTVLLNAWRARQRRRRPAPLGPEHLERFPDPAAPELLSEAEERRLLLERALALLKDEFGPATWRVFCAYALDGRPAAEVAAEAGTSANAVYIVKSRVLERLRRELRGLLD